MDIAGTEKHEVGRARDGEVRGETAAIEGLRADGSGQALLREGSGTEQGVAG